MNLMNKIMLSCVKATQLMELKGHVGLSAMQNIQLQMHAAMCLGCRNYMQQTELINQLIQKHFTSAAATGDTTTLEQTIIEELNQSPESN